MVTRKKTGFYGITALVRCTVMAGMINRVISYAELCLGDNRRRKIRVVELAATCEISCQIVRVQLYSFNRWLPTQAVVYSIFILCDVPKFMRAYRCDVSGGIGWLIQKLLKKTQAEKNRAV